MDPFSATPMMILICDIVEPSTGELYARDPRSTAKRAEAYLKASGIGDTAYVGPEAEFFVFDDVKFGLSYNGGFYSLDDVELPVNSGRDYRSEEHTSELQSLMRNSYAVFSLKTKKQWTREAKHNIHSKSYRHPTTY